MDDTEFDQWEDDVGEVELPSLFTEHSTPTQENVIALLSAAMRETNKSIQAQLLLDVANLAIALADKILGAQQTSIKCVAPNRH